MFTIRVHTINKHTMTPTAQNLIEVAMQIKEISAENVRDESIICKNEKIEL